MIKYISNEIKTDTTLQEEINEKIDYLCEKYDAKIKYLKSPLVDISSSELREMIRDHKTVCGHVPQAVEEFISKEGLYE